MIYANYSYTRKNHEKSIFSHVNFAGQELIDLCHSLDVEILEKRGKHGPNYVAPPVVEPPAVD